MFHTSHSIVCDAPAANVYELIADSASWPQIFEPCLAVKCLSATASEEVIEITALVNGSPMVWRSKREFYEDIFAISSTVLTLMPLVASMTVDWNVLPLPAEQCLLVLEHRYTICEAVTGLVEGVHTAGQAKAYIEAGIDKNSTVELANIKTIAERGLFESATRKIERQVHSIVCEAPAAKVYGIIRDVTNWPLMFEACVRSSILESTPEYELARIEALQEGRHISWVTKREYHDEVLRVDFTLTEPMPLLHMTHGQWRVFPITPERSILSIQRTWQLVENITGIRDDIHTREQAHAFVTRFFEDNAAQEMIAIRAYVEERVDDVCVVRDQYEVPLRVEELYELLADVRRWPTLLPHCESVDLRYDDSIYQEFVMRVQTKAGSEEFRSIRHCDRDALTISYFQPEPPAVLSSHHGSWVLHRCGTGTAVVATHRFTLAKDECRAVFGPDQQHARMAIERILRDNSRTTIEACTDTLRVTC